MSIDDLASRLVFDFRAEWMHRTAIGSIGARGGVDDDIEQVRCVHWRCECIVKVLSQAVNEPVVAVAVGSANSRCGCARALASVCVRVPVCLHAHYKRTRAHSAMEDELERPGSKLRRIGSTSSTCWGRRGRLVL
jgi:hypothetical protein